jgi:hypothetical protein
MTGQCRSLSGERFVKCGNLIRIKLVIQGDCPLVVFSPVEDLRLRRRERSRSVMRLRLQEKDLALLIREEVACFAGVTRRKRLRARREVLPVLVPASR